LDLDKKFLCEDLVDLVPDNDSEPFLMKKSKTTPNMADLKLYSIDLSTPGSALVIKKQREQQQQQQQQLDKKKTNKYYYIKKSEIRSMSINNKSIRAQMTPLLVSNLQKQQLDLENSGQAHVASLSINDPLFEITANTSVLNRILSPPIDQTINATTGLSYNTIPCIDDLDLSKLLDKHYLEDMSICQMSEKIFTCNRVHFLDEEEEKLDKETKQQKEENCIHNLINILKLLATQFGDYVFQKSTCSSSNELKANRDQFDASSIRPKTKTH